MSKLSCTAAIFALVACVLLSISCTTRFVHADQQNNKKIAKLWTITGEGFHRTATLNLEVPSSTSSKNVNIKLGVPKDLYVDVNELSKKSSLTISSSSCNNNNNNKEVSFSFVSSSSDFPIDLEGPSFRSKTVPQKRTELSLSYASASSSPSSPSSSTSTSSSASSSCSYLLKLVIPIHCRYATPIGEIISSSGGGGGGGISDLLKFEEHYQDLRCPLEILDLSLDGKKITTKSSTKEHDVILWKMPVPHSSHARTIYSATNALVVVMGVFVIVAALLPGSKHMFGFLL